VKTPPIGTVGWVDLTVQDAPKLREFYERVVGWKSSAHSMGDYSDFVMEGPDGAGVAGVCHKRGTNSEMPSGWMVYFVVADLAASLVTLSESGGELISERRDFAVVRDPTGAAFALHQFKAE
jgi:uncharacterized protein